MMPSAFFKPSFAVESLPEPSLTVGLLPAFFALFSSAFVGSILKTTKRLSAVKNGRDNRALAAMSSAT